MKVAKILVGLVLAVLIAAGVMNVQSVDRIQTVDEKSVVVARGKTEDQLGSQDQRVDGDSHQSAQEVAAPVEPERPAEPEAPAATPPVPAVPQAEVIDHSICADPMICRIGDCNKSYAIVFSTAYCGPCKSMVPYITKLRGEGYHIYYWHTDQFPEAVKKLGGVTRVPATYVFDKGKLLSSRVGVIDEAGFRRLLTPHAVAPTPVGNDKPTYNLIGE